VHISHCECITFDCFFVFFLSNIVECLVVVVSVFVVFFIIVKKL